MSNYARDLLFKLKTKRQFQTTSRVMMYILMN
jgi:hypothetical protein